MCGTFNVLHIGVEYVGNTLSLDIIDRRNQRQHSNIVMKSNHHTYIIKNLIIRVIWTTSSPANKIFYHNIYRIHQYIGIYCIFLYTSYSESELWYLILSCIEGLLYNNLHNIDYFDLHPTHIRITEDGVIKLVHIIDIPKDGPLCTRLTPLQRTKSLIGSENLTVPSSRIIDIK